VCVVDRGEAEVRCGGESYVAVPGSVILLSPYELHREMCLSREGWSLRAMHPAPATMQRVLGMSEDVLSGMCFDRPVVHDPQLADLLDRMFRVSDRTADGAIDEVTAHGVRNVLKCQLRHVDNRERLRGGRRAVELVRTRINTRRDMASMTELSALTGLSRFHLSRTFRDVTGLPPYAYYEQVRIARAKLLIRQGHQLSTVAMTLGFSDQSHFHRQFRSESATTPGRYARALRSVFCPPK
jgi:AraC-like DNA-binding protein